MRQSAVANQTYAILRNSQLWAAHVTLLVMVSALALQVAAREFNLQVDWTEELSRFSFISMVFVSASYATQTGAHLRVSAFADLMSKWEPLKWLIPKLEFSAMLTFDVVFFWLCIGNLIEGLRYVNASPALNFNENLLFIAPLIGFGAAIVYRLLSLFFAPPPATGMVVAKDLHP
jgi:TRAP-type C4-dicarboxylate transport system permease small subunit